jgi:alcohol dehydrogenase (cytochrome c)
LIRSRQVIWVTLIFSAAQIAAGSEATQQVATEVNVHSKDLLAPQPGANWLSYNGDYSGRRYSELAQITAKNVDQLRAQWVFHSRNSDHLEVTPIAGYFR